MRADWRVHLGLMSGHDENLVGEAAGARGASVTDAEILGVESARVESSTLRLSGRNPRRGDVEAIARSLEAHGQFRPLIVNRPTMEVLCGNHTLLAARTLGWRWLDVYFVEVGEDQARRIALVDNRTSDLAEWDASELVELLGELGDLTGTGFDEADLDALLDEVAAGAPVEDDDVPPLPDQPVTKLGDVVALGSHRLVCGDARDPIVAGLVMGGEQADLLWTDPPYGVDYEGKTAARLRLRGDATDGLAELVDAAFAAADTVLRPGAGLYVCHPSGCQAAAFYAAFQARGWLIRQGLVWLKDSMVLGHADYHHQHEPLVYGFKPGVGRLGRGGKGWYGGNRQVSVLEVPRPRASRLHPTTKPVELVAIALRNSTTRRGIVLDPFAGSGSTMVACEQLGRVARLVEIDPAYCDVIVHRYEALTGKQAVR